MPKPHVLLLLFATVLFGWLVYSFVNVDFWNDEIYTLKAFTFVPLHTTLTDYHAPNNHVFLNLVDNLYLRLLGINTLKQLMQTPYKLRCLMVFYALLTAIYLYLFVRAVSNKNTAALAIVILLSTMPYCNFFWEVRGYGLSTLFNAAILYHGYHFSEQLRWKNAIALLFCVSLCIYTLPTNLYLMIAWLGFIFLQLVCTQFYLYYTQKRANLAFTNNIFVRLGQNTGLIIPSNVFKNALFLLLCLVIGTILGFAFYTPMLAAMFGNKYAVGGNMAYNWHSLDALAYSLLHFASWRYGLYLLWLIAILTFFRQIKSKNNQLSTSNNTLHHQTIPYIWLTAYLFVMPFVIDALLNKAAPWRVFVPLAPFYSATLALSIGYLLKQIPIFRQHLSLNYVAIGLYCIAAWAMCWVAVRQQLQHDLLHNGRNQDLNVQYYQHYYEPLKELRLLSNHRKTSPVPVLLIDAEPHDISDYLTQINIPFYDAAKQDSLLQNTQQLYVVLRYKPTFAQQIHEKYPNWQFSFLSADTLRYPKVAFGEKK